MFFLWIWKPQIASKKYNFIKKRHFYFAAKVAVLLKMLPWSSKTLDIIKLCASLLCGASTVRQ